MTIKRRFLLTTLVSSLIIAITNPIILGLTRKKYLNSKRKHNSPFFLGWYDYVENPQVPARVFPRGINLLLPYIEKSQPEQLKTFLDAAQTAKVKVIVEIYRSIVQSENIAAVKDFIRTYKNHPAVYAWYLYDEPEIAKPNPIPPDLLTKVYKAIKAEDRSKPVALVFSDIDKIDAYGDAMDLLMWDSYPCNNGVPEFQWVPGYRKSLNRVTELADARRQPFWNVLQAYSGHGLNKRLPTRAEFRYMFYISVLAGVDSLLFWMYPWSTPAWNESVLYPTIEEFRADIAALTNLKPNNNVVAVNSPDVEIRLFPIPKTKKFLAIAISHTGNPVTVTAKFDNKLAGKAVAVNKKIVAQISNRSSLQIALDSYEVRLYKIG
jgi:hypothetical protein